MENHFSDLYENLLKGIDACRNKHKEMKEQIECCFHLCETVNLQIEREMAVTDFSSTADEINFFKTIQPRFNSLVEFYSIAYRAELFAPELDSEKQAFWEEEANRTRQFFEMHEGFYQYIKSGCGSRDEELFLRSKPNFHHYQKLLAQLKAREMYLEKLQAVNREQ